MTNDEFLREIHEYIDMEYKEMLSTKEEMESLLFYFHQVCKKNNIRYFLAYGSLLGEVRDGGPIPWDSDMDVCMPLTDAKKLIHSFHDWFGSDYYIESNYTNKDFPYFEARIGKQGYPLELVHIDIFYCIGGPEKESKECEKLKNTLNHLFIQRMQKQFIKHPIEKDKKIAIIKNIYYFLNNPFKTVKSIDRKIEKLSRKYKYGQCPSVLPINYVRTAHALLSVEPVATKRRNCRELNYPNDENAVLNDYYKDYNSYLPIASRFEEFYQWVLRRNEMNGIHHDDMEYRT